MSGLSIHEKRQLAEQLAREQLSKSGQYRFGIPQSVLNAKANEFLRLSDKEIQKKFNEYFQSTGLNAKPKDLWDSMGLNLEQKKKAEAHMKGLQKQINTKYMQPQKAVSKKSTTTKNELPSDVKLETRQIIVNMLKQAYANKNEEFRTYLLNNRGNFAEGAMEFHDLGSKIADGLTDLGIVVVRSETRTEIHDKLLKKEAEIDVLADSIKDEKAFNELFKKYFHEDFDYQTAFDYICASSEFTTQDSANKIKKFDKKFEGLAGKDLKSADDYMGNANRTGGLLDLGFQVGLMYASGGFSAIAKYAQMTAKGGVELAENVVTKVAGKKFAQSAAGKAVSQGVGIVSAQTTSAGANAVAFQTTKVAELAGESIATGHVDTEKANVILEGTESLFKFGYVGGAISGPLGMQVKGLTTKLLNSKPIINQILTKGITNKPTPLTSVFKDISEHSEAIGEVLKFGTEFGINAGYMAYDEGVSYTDAMANLAQMDGVSKMVIAMLGGKNLEFLTPKKVQQIKTDLAGYKVNIAIYEGQKVYSVKDAKGKETVLATPEELFMFILDKEAQKVGVKAEHSKADNTPNPLPQGAREQGEVRSKGIKKPYVTPETVIKKLLASEVTTNNKVQELTDLRNDTELTNTETKVEIPENTNSKQPQVNNSEVKPKIATASETPIQTQQRLIKELENAKSREDFSRITQEMKNLPKTEEYQAIRQRLGGEYFQRYNEWKADLHESIRSIINMATDKEVNNITKKSPNMQYLAELLCTKRFVCRQISENIVAGETFANKSIEDLKLLKDSGVKTVIDFREYDEDYKTMCKQIGLQYKSCPLIHIAGLSKQTLFSGKNNQNVSEDFVKNLKLLLDLTKQGSVYMGCNYGIDRTNFGITLVYMFSDSSDIYVPTILPSDMGSAKTLLNRNLDLIRKIVKRLNPQQREYLGLSDNIDESLNLKIKKITSKNQVPLPSTITQLIEEKLNNRK